MGRVYADKERRPKYKNNMKNILDPYFLYKMGWIKPKKHFTLLSL
jgi:hypothetical protein